MDAVAHKRAAEPEQGDAYALCTNCSRLSYNLKNCDKCGSQLSDDSSAHSYSADAKRARLEMTNSANSSAASEDSSVSKPSDAGVRPQQLFVNRVNINNLGNPIANMSLGMGVSRPAAAVSSAPSPSVASVANMPALPVLRPRLAGSQSQAGVVPVAMTYTGGGTAYPPLSRQQVVAVSSTPAAPVAQRASVVSQQNGSVMMTLPSYNLQPPPPPFSSNIARLPVVVSSSPAIPTMVASAASPQSAHNWQISAVQIRIGSKKFKPISPVTFKDEGVLFMLKDFTYAPVLLNTRAIIKCRANLSTFSYPVLFLYLENSCMRQIRNIFGLSAAEFSSTSPVELRRCISIFPVFGSENRSQVLNVSFSIKRTFEAMVRRYPRSTPILEEINNEQVIDTLIDASDISGEGGTEGTGTSAAETSSAAAASGSASNSTSSNVASTSTTSTPAVRNGTHVVSTVSNTVSSAVRPVPNSTSSVLPAPNASSNAQGSPQVLVIPQDAARWQALQKNLVVGGVYHVMVHTGQRKYCLWNGTQLVPCMVQNTEVQVSCQRVHIGTLRALCVGQVRVRAEPTSGIFFTIKGESFGQQEISITPDDIVSCEICFCKPTTVIFINTSWATAEKVRAKLNMPMGKEPSFDPNGADLRKKYLVLFLNDVNRDQEEALTNMKFSRNPTQSSFEVIDLQAGLCRLVQIISDIRTPALAAESLQQRRISGTDGFEKLVQELFNTSTDAADYNGNAAADDDDDDDVIMTQEEVGIKCPYTQQVMKDPVRNKVCGHNYEKIAIMEFIVRKKGTAKCPYAGCGQHVALRTEDLVDNLQLKEYIAKYTASNKSAT